MKERKARVKMINLTTQRGYFNFCKSRRNSILTAVTTNKSAKYSKEQKIKTNKTDQNRIAIKAFISELILSSKTKVIKATGVLKKREIVIITNKAIILMTNSKESCSIKNVIEIFCCFKSSNQNPAVDAIAHPKTI